MSRTAECRISSQTAGVWGLSLKVGSAERVELHFYLPAKFQAGYRNENLTILGDSIYS